MKKIRLVIKWSVLVLILLLIIFSVYGAFIGADRAQELFNTVPLTLYWIIFILLLGMGIGFFKRLLCSPGLLFVHLGCIIILFGSMWGSKGGHQLRKKMFGSDKVRAGRVVVFEGMSEKRVLRRNVNVNFMIKGGSLEFYEGDKQSLSVLSDEDERLFLLPFEIRLKDFRIEYYEQPRLFVRDMDGIEMLFEDVETGEKYDLGNNTQVTIIEVFKNLKLRQKDGGMQAYDDEGPGSNPALRTVIMYEDGTEEEQFVFAKFSGHMGKTKKFIMQYHLTGMVKDYFSDIQVLEEEKVVMEKTIQVNDPLYYGGYHFYQSSYDSKGEQYSILSVSSDSGLYFVYTGYLLLMIGIIWVMWMIPLLRHRNISEIQDGDNHGN